MLKNIFLSLSIFCTLALSVSCSSNDNTTDMQTDAETTAVENETPQNRPKTTMSFTDTLKDFGTKQQGEMLHFAYEFTNTGNEPLFIEDVIPSCGCSVADYPKQAIAPGGKGEIKVEFDTDKGGLGSVQKLITVVANDAGRAQHYLLFQGTVEPKF